MDFALTVWLFAFMTWSRRFNCLLSQKQNCLPVTELIARCLAARLPDTGIAPHYKDCLLARSQAKR